jgi:GcrA cell cycle regulator
MPTLLKRDQPAAGWHSRGEKMGITDRWDAAKEQLLRELWAEGKSGSLIGAKLGMTRNAIIGKVHRLGLPKRSTEERNRNIRNTMRQYRAEQKPKTPKPKREKLNKLQFPT